MCYFFTETRCAILKVDTQKILIASPTNIIYFLKSVPSGTGEVINILVDAGFLIMTHVG